MKRIAATVNKASLRKAESILYALLITILLCLMYSPIANSKSTELHIIVDTQAFNLSKDVATVDLNAIRLISGLLPTSVQTHIWEYQNEFILHTPIYSINKQRKPSPTIRINQHPSGNLVNDLNALAQQFKSNNEQRHVIVISPSQRSSKTVLNSPLIEELITKLVSTNTRLSTFLVDTGPIDPLFSLLSITSHGSSKTIKQNSLFEKELLEFLDYFISIEYLPLHKTLLKIDDSVKEATAILYKEKNKTNHIEIIPPFGEPVTLLNSPSHIKWIQTPTFDIVNIEQPNAGTWQIFSENKGNTQIIIDSDLNLTATMFPSVVESNTFQSLDIALKKGVQTITDEATMNYVVVKVAQIQNGLDQFSWFPADKGKNGDRIGNDGVFTVPLRETLQDGSYLFQIDLDGNKFLRQLKRYIRVSDQLAWIHQEYIPETNEHMLMIVPNKELVKPESILISAIVRGPNDKKRDIDIHPVNDYTWGNTFASGESIELNIAATNHRGRTASVWLDPITFSQPQKNLQPIQIPAGIKPSQQAGHHHDTIDHKEEHDHHSDLEENITISEASMLAISLQLLALHIVLIAAGWFGYRYWKKREETWRLQLEDRLSYE